MKNKRVTLNFFFFVTGNPDEAFENGEDSPGRYRGYNSAGGPIDDPNNYPSEYVRGVVSCPNFFIAVYFLKELMR